MNLYLRLSSIIVSLVTFTYMENLAFPLCNHFLLHRRKKYLLIIVGIFFHYNKKIITSRAYGFLFVNLWRETINFEKIRRYSKKPMLCPKTLNIDINYISSFILSQNIIHVRRPLHLHLFPLSTSVFLLLIGPHHIKIRELST